MCINTYSFLISRIVFHPDIVPTPPPKNAHTHIDTHSRYTFETTVSSIHWLERGLLNSAETDCLK